MEKLRKGRTEAARLSGLLQHVRYPIGRVDIEYRAVDGAGAQGDEVHTLKLVLSCDEARQMAAALNKFADAIDAAGGTKQ